VFGDFETMPGDEDDDGVEGVAANGDDVELDDEELKSEFFFLNFSCILAGPFEDILSCLNLEFIVSSSICTPVLLLLLLLLTEVVNSCVLVAILVVEVGVVAEDEGFEFENKCEVE